MTEVYVVDTETTGLSGYGRDLVLDIGIVKVDTEAGTAEDVYSQIIGYDISTWPTMWKEAWIFSHSDLTLESVTHGLKAERAAREVQRILNGKICTSYNTAFDFGKFLRWAPWMINARYAPDIMVAAHREVDGDYEFEDGSTSWPRLDKAYAEICPDDPVGLKGVQRHRALSDAQAAAAVMLRLIERDEYPRRVVG